MSCGENQITDDDFFNSYKLCDSFYRKLKESHFSFYQMTTQTLIHNAKTPNIEY